MSDDGTIDLIVLTSIGFNREVDGTIQTIISAEIPHFSKFVPWKTRGSGEELAGVVKIVSPERTDYSVGQSSEFAAKVSRREWNSSSTFGSPKHTYFTEVTGDTWNLFPGPL